MDEPRFDRLRADSPAVRFSRPDLGLLIRRVGLAAFFVMYAGASFVLRKEDFPLPSVPMALTAPPTLLALATILLGLVVGNVGGRARRTALRIDGDALVLESLGATRRIARADVRAAWIEPVARGGCQMVIETANGQRMRARLSSEQTAHEMLSAMGLGAAQRSLRVTLGSPWKLAAVVAVTTASSLLSVWLASEIVTAMFSLQTPMSNMVFLLGAYLTALATLRSTRRTTVVIGADGLSATTAMNGEFQSFHDVVEVVELNARVILVQRDGTHLPTFIYDTDPMRLRAVATRVRQALEAFQRSGARLAAMELLDRNGRSMEAWAGELRALALRSGGSGYRDLSFTREALGEVIRDPRVTPERRIAAALALSSIEDPGGRTQVRAAAESCANEPLREALEHAADGTLNERSLARALSDER